jgi:hypothetical protein
MTQMHPHMTATVVGLPEVTPITEENVLTADASPGQTMRILLM